MNNVPDNVQLEEIRKLINNRLEEVNPHNVGYINRLYSHPQYLQMPHWANHFEAVYMATCPYLQGKILDFGCGSGHIDVVLARSGFNIHGIDLSSIAVDIANYIASIENDEVKNNLTFSVEDITSEPSVYHEYDCCLSTHVFEHLLEIGDIIEGIRKRVKPGGYLVVSVPLGYAYDDPNHVQHFMDENELRNHFTPFVEVVSIERDPVNQVLRAFLKL